MMNAQKTDKSAENLGDLSVIRNFFVVSLIDNFDDGYLEDLENRLLTLLAKRQKIQGVIFACNEVVTTDHHDLRRLKDMFKSIKLVGGRIGLCCINPGLAAVMVTSNLSFEKEVIGSEIDDLLDCL